MNTTKKRPNRPQLTDRERLEKMLDNGTELNRYWLNQLVNEYPDLVADPEQQAEYRRKLERSDLKWLIDNGKKLYPNQLRRVVIKHRDLVSEEQLKQLEKEYLQSQLQTVGLEEIPRPLVEMIVRNYPEIATKEQILKLRRRLMTAHERSIRDQIARKGVHTLSFDDLRSLTVEGHVFEFLGQLVSDQLRFLLEDEKCQGALTLEQLEEISQRLEAAKSPLQRRLEQKFEQVGPERMTFRQLKLLRNVRPDLVTQGQIDAAKARESSRKKANWQRRADESRASKLSGKGASNRRG